jgi:hypothetical protein
VDAAWVTFPALRVRRLSQRYEHLGDGRWRYRSGDFVADLVVDGHGLVRRYGDGIWSADPGSAPDGATAAGR